MSDGSARSRTPLPALALLAAAGLVLEVALTRLYAILFYPPAVFAILSLAILGIGLGAAAATAQPAWASPRHASSYAALAALAAMLIPLAATRPTPGLKPLLFAPVVLPYFFVGLALVAFFASAAGQSPRLYLADLIGAGLGAILAVPLLDALGGLNAVFAAAALFGLAAALSRPRLLPVAALVLALFLTVANPALRLLAVDAANLPTDKPLGESLRAGGQIVHTGWDAFARTDLVAPADGSPYRLYMDGAAGSLMPPAAGDDVLWQDIGFFPFATEQPQRVFVIGPGGGLDVWFGLQSGAESIVAVEVNRASVDVVQQFSAYNGDLYNQPAVRVVHDEGRSVLRREGQRYDLIFLSQVVTLAAERSGFALVEESAYTVEAFADYLDHLRPGGQLALKLYDEPTLTRALSTALAALRRQARLSDAQALDHVLVLLDPRAEPPVPLLVVRNTPFSRDDSLSLGAVAREVGFAPLFLPHALAQPPLDAVYAAEATYDAVIARSPHNLAPTYDDRPFFHQFERGIPATLRPLLAALAVLVLAGGALLFLRGRRADASGLRWSPLYFAALGLGFITIELALIQQVRLFLGHPTLAVTTVLAVLLVGGGLGSGLAGRRWSADDLPIWPALAVVVLALAWTLLWPWLADQFLAAGRLLRVTIVALSLLPLALFMGMPFPLGLRLLGAAGRRDVALAWAVNGVMTVVGSALAVTVALRFGFSRVLLAGVAAYALALLSTPALAADVARRVQTVYHSANDLNANSREVSPDAHHQPPTPA